MNKTLAVFLISAIITVVFFISIEFVNNSDETLEVDPSFQPDGKIEQLSSKDKTRINEQKEMEQKLQNQYAAGTYSLDDPFITVDPYGVTPLTALAMFETDEPVQITVTVEGKDKNGDVQHTYDQFKKDHSVPVLGLYPDYENTVTIEATTESGETTSSTMSIQTEPLPDDFLTTNVVESNPEKMENGMTFIIPSSRYVYAVDHNAEVRWYSTLWNSHVFERLENGNLLYITKEEGQEKYNEMLEMDMLGKVYNSYLIQLGNYEDTKDRKSVV